MGVLFVDALGFSAQPEVHDAARAAVHQVATGLADLLKRGQQAGDIRRDLDPTTGAWWLISLLASHGFRTTLMTDRAALEPALSDLVVETLTRPAR